MFVSSGRQTGRQCDSMAMRLYITHFNYARLIQRAYTYVSIHQRLIMSVGKMIGQIGHSIIGRSSSMFNLLKA